MNYTMDDVMQAILKGLSDIDHVQPSDIPNIELYMDQVTTFIDSQLEHSKRHEQDKILTKTMINNYAKNHLLPSPNKKKYSKEHVLMLLFIYYFKSFLSISDIQAILGPLADQYFQNQDGLNIQSIYDEIYHMEISQMEQLKSDITDKFKIASEAFLGSPKEEQDYLRLFSLICLLSFDVYCKKQVIESIIDSFSED